MDIKAGDRVKHVVTGRFGTVKAVEADGWFTVSFDGGSFNTLTVPPNQVKLIGTLLPEKQVGGRCRKCAKFNEYQSGPYTCYECRAKEEPTQPSAPPPKPIRVGRLDFYFPYED